jgi:hypothetical protein
MITAAVSITATKAGGASIWNQYAYEGDYVRQNLINANPNFWFTFVGRDLTLLSRNGNNDILHITIDGEYMGEFNLTRGILQPALRPPLPRPGRRAACGANSHPKLWY